VPKQKLSSDPDYTATVHKSDIGRKRKRYSAVRKPWSSEELHLVMHAFQKNAADGSVPGYNLIENLKKVSFCAYGRSREQIRAVEHIWHDHNKRKRKTTKNTPLLYVLKHVDLDHL